MLLLLLRWHLLHTRHLRLRRGCLLLHLFMHCPGRLALGGGLLPARLPSRARGGVKLPSTADQWQWSSGAHRRGSQARRGRRGRQQRRRAATARGHAPPTRSHQAVHYARWTRRRAAAWLTLTRGGGGGGDGGGAAQLGRHSRRNRSVRGGRRRDNSGRSDDGGHCYRSGRERKRLRYGWWGKKGRRRRSEDGCGRQGGRWQHQLLR